MKAAGVTNKQSRSKLAKTTNPHRSTPPRYMHVSLTNEAICSRESSLQFSSFAGRVFSSFVIEQRQISQILEA